MPFEIGWNSVVGTEKSRLQVMRKIGQSAYKMQRIVVRFDLDSCFTHREIANTKSICLHIVFQYMNS